MPRRPNSSPDSLLGRTLKLLEKDIRTLERKARARFRAAKATAGVDVRKDPVELLDADDRKALIATGEFLRKTAGDAKPPDLSKMSDVELDRLSKRLGVAK